jgi:hypothetical protein
MLKQWCLSLALVTLLAAAPVRAQDLSQPSASPAYTGLSSSPHTGGGLLPSSLFDPTRFSISNSLVFGVSSGSSAYGNGTAGLFTSSLGYKLSPNMALNVDIGAHINPAYGGNDPTKGVFLEAAAFNWRPGAHSAIRVEYRDVRSPLQNPWGYGGYSPAFGYTPLGSGFAGDPLRN